MANLANYEPLQVQLTSQDISEAIECQGKPEFTHVKVDLQKVKIYNKDFLEVEYMRSLIEITHERDEEGNLVTNERLLTADIWRGKKTMRIHDDLRKAFLLLAPHVLFINKFVPDDYFNAINQLQHESVELDYEPLFTHFEQREASPFEHGFLARIMPCGVDFSGVETMRSISIVSKIKDAAGKETASKTALVSLDSEDDKYYFQKKLREVAAILENEIMLYLFGGKFGKVKNNEPELPFDYNGNQD